MWNFGEDLQPGLIEETGKRGEQNGINGVMNITKCNTLRVTFVVTEKSKFIFKNM